MSYPNFLGEFVAPFEKDDWVNYVKWNERKPVLIRGALNQWELERTRAVWQAEQAAWAKIIVLKETYKKTEQAILKDYQLIQEHIRELERVTRTNIGDTKSGVKNTEMILSVVKMLPVIGKFFSAGMTLIGIGSGRRQQRAAELIAIIEEAQGHIRQNQYRLGVIQQEVKALLTVTEQAMQAGSAKMQADRAQSAHAQEAYRLQQQTQSLLIDQELARARQLTPIRVRYINDL